MTSSQTREPRTFGRTPKSDKPEFEVPEIEDGLYPVAIKNVVENTSPDGNDQYVIDFEFEDFTNSKGEPLSLRAWVRIPPTLINEGVVNEKSKLYELLIALGYTDDDLAVVPSEWQGAKLRVMVENKTIQQGENAGKVRPKITLFKKAVASQKAEAPKAAPAAKTSAPKQQAAAPAPAPAAADDEDF